MNYHDAVLEVRRSIYSSQIEDVCNGNISNILRYYPFTQIKEGRIIMRFPQAPLPEVMEKLKKVGYYDFEFIQDSNPSPSEPKGGYLSFRVPKHMEKELPFFAKDIPLEEPIISAQECRDKLQIKREELNSKDSEEVYQEQKKKCERELDGWIRCDYTREYTHVYLKLPPHPRLVSELEELGYTTETEVCPTSYILRISLPRDVENISLQDESSNVKESAQEEGFLSKLKSFVKSRFYLQ